MHGKMRLTLLSTCSLLIVASCCRLFLYCEGLIRGDEVMISSSRWIDVAYLGCERASDRLQQ
jgi:hypothetical protein